MSSNIILLRLNATSHPKATDAVIRAAYRIIAAGRPWWTPNNTDVRGARIGQASITIYPRWPTAFIRLGRRTWWTDHPGVIDATRRISQPWTVH